MVDCKPLLHDRPPAYNAVPAAYDNYGAIPPVAPPPYSYPEAPGYPPAHSTPAVSQQPYTGTYTIIQPSVVVVGGCPACRVGVLEDDFTCLGILCAILCFPLGVLFCFALRQRRCPNCGASFG
ncbi:membrane protein BRI3 [Gouania willdenowi]|uniref:Membrane protein BRI3 n=1 Tax=Gouania willdenowi TaxID=441366 RepID=A0A8C5DYK7_GOUWI|nr:brain protein I3 [Gouania willdenowi]